MKRNYGDSLLCILSGAATGACLMLPDFGFMVFVTAAPAFSVIRKHLKPRSCFAFVIALCAVGYFPAFSVNPGFDAATNFWIDLAVYAIICLVHGFVLTLTLFISFRISCPLHTRPIYVALFWAATEWLLGFGPFAWPTLRLSLAIWKYPFLFGSARFFGQLFVSAVIISVNYLLSKAILSKTTKKAVTASSLALLVFLFNLSFSAFSPSAGTADASVALVQPGLTSIDGYTQSQISRRAHELASEAAVGKPELIVLPEGSMPATFATGEPTNLYSWGGITRLSGGDMLSCGNRALRSVAYHYTSDGKLSDTRKKILEVPFFENGVNAPFRWIPEAMEPPVETKAGKAGIMICYESMFSSFARTHALNGAEFFCVVTNDSWFDTSLAQNLHLAHGVYRATETGRYLVQSALNGKTAVIDRSGKVVAVLDSEKSGILSADICTTPSNSPYLIWGDLWLGISLLIILSLGIITKQRRKNVQKTSL